jgi:enamine deaminase RidA (YjgF/YER057c/UK114 family)
VSKEQTETKQYIHPAGVPKPLQPYTPVIRAGNMVYVAGQVPFDADRNLIGAGDPGAQAEQCWKNIKLCLESAGASVSDIVKVVIFFADLQHVKYEMEVRRRLFPDGRFPVATITQVARVGTNDDVLMEIDVTAILP